MDQYELIRTGHRVYKKSISELARETGHSRNMLCRGKCCGSHSCNSHLMTYLTSPPKGWQPPFCPNGKCKFHNQLMEKWRYKDFGFYYRQTDNRKVQRYQCLSCKRTFSTQTFSTTYWQKKPELDALVFSKTVNGMANRQIARDLKVDPATINHKLERLGRHSLLFLTKQMETAKPATEIVFDGFETFEYSQYYPYHHNIAVEKDTDFILFFNDSELRRKGSMTEKQRPRRAELEEMFGHIYSLAKFHSGSSTKRSP